MYVFEHDAAHHAYAGRFKAGGDMQADFAQHLQHLGKALELSNGTHQTLNLVIIFDSNHDVPDAASRQKVAEFQRGPLFNPRIALVTTNVLMRGVLTAIDWIRGGKIKMLAVPTLEKGLEALEQDAGGPLPELRRLAQRVAAP